MCLQPDGSSRQEVFCEKVVLKPEACNFIKAQKLRLQTEKRCIFIMKGKLNLVDSTRIYSENMVLNSLAKTFSCRSWKEHFSIKVSFY